MALFLILFRGYSSLPIPHTHHAVAHTHAGGGIFHSHDGLAESLDGLWMDELAGKPADARGHAHSHSHSHSHDGVHVHHHSEGGERAASHTREDARHPGQDPAREPHKKRAQDADYDCLLSAPVVAAAYISVAASAGELSRWRPAIERRVMRQDTRKFSIRAPPVRPA